MADRFWQCALCAAGVQHEKFGGRRRRDSRNGGEQVLDGQVRDHERGLLDGRPPGGSLCGHFGRRGQGKEGKGGEGTEPGRLEGRGGLGTLRWRRGKRGGGQTRYGPLFMGDRVSAGFSLHVLLGSRSAHNTPAMPIIDLRFPLATNLLVVGPGLPLATPSLAARALVELANGCIAPQLSWESCIERQRNALSRLEHRFCSVSQPSAADSDVVAPSPQLSQGRLDGRNLLAARLRIRRTPSDAIGAMHDRR